MFGRQSQVVLFGSQSGASREQVAEVGRQSLRDPQSRRHRRMLVVEWPEFNRPQAFDVHCVEVLVAHERGIPELRILRRRFAPARGDRDGIQVLDAGAAAPAGHDVEERVFRVGQRAPEPRVLLDERRHDGGHFLAIPLGLTEVRPVVGDAGGGEARADEIGAGENGRVGEHVVVRRDVMVRGAVGCSVERGHGARPGVRQFEPDVRGSSEVVGQRHERRRADEHGARVRDAVREIAEARRGDRIGHPDERPAAGLHRPAARVRARGVEGGVVGSPRMEVADAVAVVLQTVEPG